MAPSERVQIGADKGTYLATLWGKAQDAGAADPILGDTFAADAVSRIDFDFRTLKLPDGGDITLPMRALHFDTWAREFLASNTRAVVLHLGCGLDSRVFRVDPGPEVRWFDVDLPDVIALRAQLYPEREGTRLVASSVTALAWLDEVPCDAPVLVIAEGLCMYLPEADGLALFRRITERFPRGQIAFDGYSGWMVRLVTRLATVRGAKVELVWGVEDPLDLTRQIPALRLTDDVRFLVMPALLARLGTTPFKRAMYAFVQRFRFYRDLIRHLRYEFS